MFSRRLRGTRERYPNNNGESIFLALNHKSCMSKNQTNRVAKNDDHLKNGDVGTINSSINGTDFSKKAILIKINIYLFQLVNNMILLLAYTHFWQTSSSVR